MDQWGPKHVELTYVWNKIQSLKIFVYLVELHIYQNTSHINIFLCVILFIVMCMKTVVHL